MKLYPQHIHLISLSSGDILFFHTSTLQIYPFDRDSPVLEFLLTLQRNNIAKTKQIYGEADFDQIYDFVCKTLSSAPKSLLNKKIDTDVEEYRSIVLPIAASCNLNCPYCFAQTDGGFKFPNYTKEDIEKVAVFLMENTPVEQPVNICFFGGEPLLKINIIKFTIQYFKDKYPNRSISYSITTNGTILNDEIIQLFKENNFAIMLSIDGPNNEFNLRHFRDGKSSVKKVLENIEWLRREKISLELRATLVNENPYILDSYRFFEELKVPFDIVFAYSSANKTHHYADYKTDNLKQIEQQLDDVLAFYIDKLQAREKIYNNMILRLSNYLRFRVKKRLSCGAGVSYFTITGDGNIFSCAHFMNNIRYKIGNIAIGIEDKSKYIPVDITEIKDCKNCWIKFLCVGDCVAQKILEGKSNNTSQIEGKCSLEKITWSFYIKLYYYIMQIAPEYFIKTKEKNSEKK